MEQWMKNAARDWLTPSVKTRPTISELEEMLAKENEGVVAIEADGSITAVPFESRVEKLAEIIARHAPPSAPVSEREAVLEEARRTIWELTQVPVKIPIPGESLRETGVREGWNQALVEVDSRIRALKGKERGND